MRLKEIKQIYENHIFSVVILSILLIYNIFLYYLLLFLLFITYVYKIYYLLRWPMLSSKSSNYYFVLTHATFSDKCELVYPKAIDKYYLRDNPGADPGYFFERFPKKE